VEEEEHRKFAYKKHQPETSQFSSNRHDKPSMSTSVMASGEIVGSIFFARDELLRVEQLTIRSSTYLIDNSRLQIYKNCTGNMLPVPLSPGSLQE
jgi:hypothetical protein